jgi:hypothetical protein
MEAFNRKKNIIHRSYKGNKKKKSAEEKLHQETTTYKLYFRHPI